MIEFVEKYIDDKGIVVPFPGTLQQQLDAIIAYAETCENDCLLAEKKLGMAEGYIKSYLPMISKKLLSQIAALDKTERESE
jgi:hypothetical protein